MKNERLLAMADCLLLEGKKTAEELAGRFEVSIRTIYRDIDSLCASGLPLVSEAGAGGGFYIEEGYRIDRSFLSPDEVSDLSSILRAFASATKDRNLERSLGKIASLGPRGSELARAGAVSGRSGAVPGRSLITRPGARTGASIAPRSGLPPPLIAELSPWGAPGCDPRIVSELRRAISERRLISFRYIDGEGKETLRKAEPFSVVIGGASWYLHAWCRLRGSFRLFKILRIRGLELLPERYDPYARTPVPPPFAFSDSGEKAEEIEVSVEGRLRQSLEESFPGLGEGPEEGGRWTYRFLYPLCPYLTNFLLYFGPGLSVLKPAALRAELARAAREIAAANDFPEEH